jgi:hypothetical protein
LALLRKLRILVVVLLGLAAIGYVALQIANHLVLQSVMDRVLEEDSRNEGLEVKVRFEHLINFNRPIVNFVGIGPPAGPLGVFRSFFQLAHELEASRFERVVLAYRGVPRVMIDGDTFADLGEQYGQVKNVELLKRFGRNLRFLNGDLVVGARSPSSATSDKEIGADGGGEMEEILSSFLK